MADIKGTRDFRIIGSIAIVASLVWILCAVLPLIALAHSWFRVGDAEHVKSVLGQLGTYGDMFGMVNCLFSGAAMIGVVYAVLLQRRELHHQQEEIEQGKREREATRKARDAELNNAAAWQRRTALIQAISFLVQAQTARLDFLKMVDYNKLEPEKQPLFYQEYKTIVADTQGKIDLLSVFVKALAKEHAGDVDDPIGFLADFGLSPEKVKDG